MTAATGLPVVILISGRGSNMQALLEARADGLPVEVRAVIASRPDAAGLEIARAAGVHTEIVSHRDFSDRADYDAALQRCIDRFDPALVILAGFMRILTPDFVSHYAGRMINIHPSLLPAFPGLNTHQRALQAGVGSHGASVHYVNSEVDGGPVVAQVTVPVLSTDSPESLAARVLEQEHRLYVTVVNWIATGKVVWKNGDVYFDGQLLQAPVQI